MPVPWWYEILQLAEKWSVPPWDVVHDKGKLLWIIRERVTSRVVARAQSDKEKHR